MPSTMANMRRILNSDLVPRLKFLGITLALHGDAAGHNIYPSVRTLAAEVGWTRRAVQGGLRDLERLHVLRRMTAGRGYASADRNPRGGHSTVYALCVEALREGRTQLHPSRPSRRTSSFPQRANSASPLPAPKGEPADTKGRSLKHGKGEAGTPDLPLIYPDLPRAPRESACREPRASPSRRRTRAPHPRQVCAPGPW